MKIKKPPLKKVNLKIILPALVAWLFFYQIACADNCYTAACYMLQELYPNNNNNYQPNPNTPSNNSNTNNSVQVSNNGGPTLSWVQSTCSSLSTSCGNSNLNPSNFPPTYNSGTTSFSINYCGASNPYCANANNDQYTGSFNYPSMLTCSCNGTTASCSWSTNYGNPSGPRADINTWQNAMSQNMCNSQSSNLP